MIPKIEDQQTAKLEKIEETPASRQILSNEKLCEENHEKTFQRNRTIKTKRIENLMPSTWIGCKMGRIPREKPTSYRGYPKR